MRPNIRYSCPYCKRAYDQVDDAILCWVRERPQILTAFSSTEIGAKVGCTQARVSQTLKAAGIKKPYTRRA